MSEGDTDKSREPTRRKILMRVLFWSIAPVALIVLALVGWFLFRLHKVSGQLRAAIERLEAAGEPLTLAELAPPEVPPDQNGAADIVRAISLLPELSHEEEEAESQVEPEASLEEFETPPPLSGREYDRVYEPVDDESEPRPTSEGGFYYSFWGPGDYPPPTEDDIRRLREIQPKFDSALAAMRAGLAKPFIRFDFNYASPMEANPHMSDLRQMSWLFYMEGWLACLEGDGEGALRSAASMFEMRRIQEREWTLISLNLTVVHIIPSHKLAQEAVEQTIVAPERLRELAAVYARESGGVNDLGILRLRGHRAAFLAFSRACQEGDIAAYLPDAEFLEAIEKFDETPPGTVTELPRKLSRIGKPLRQLYLKPQELYLLEVMDRWIETLESDEERLTPRFGLPQSSTSNAVAWMWLEPLTKLPTHLKNMTARMRTAAIGLEVAARIAEGRPAPEDLSEFDKALRMDPFTGAPLVINSSGTAWIVYSLGENRADDGGEYRWSDAHGFLDDVNFRVPFTIPARNE